MPNHVKGLLEVYEDMAEVLLALDRYRCNILGLYELRWKNFGEATTEEGHKLFFSGKQDNTSIALDFLFTRTS